MNNIDINNDVFPLIDICIAAVKDKVIIDELEKIKKSQREYMLAEANSRKKEISEIIMAISRIDGEKRKLIDTYSNLKESLNYEAKNRIEELISVLGKERDKLVEEKRKVSKRHNKI